jgi:hypothetical protein
MADRAGELPPSSAAPLALSAPSLRLVGGVCGDSGSSLLLLLLLLLLLPLPLPLLPLLLVVWAVLSSGAQGDVCGSAGRR